MTHSHRFPRLYRSTQGPADGPFRHRLGDKRDELLSPSQTASRPSTPVGDRRPRIPDLDRRLASGVRDRP